jgi:hypothetical protein
VQLAAKKIGSKRWSRVTDKEVYRTTGFRLGVYRYCSGMLSFHAARRLCTWGVWVLCIVCGRASGRECVVQCRTVSGAWLNSKGR